MRPVISASTSPISSSPEPSAPPPQAPAALGADAAPCAPSLADVPQATPPLLGGLTIAHPPSSLPNLAALTCHEVGPTQLSSDAAAALRRESIYRELSHHLVRAALSAHMPAGEAPVSAYPTLLQLVAQRVNQKFTTDDLKGLVNGIIVSDPRFDSKILPFADVEPVSLKNMARFRKWVHDVVDELVSVMRREINTLRITTPDGSIAYTQRFGHIEKQGQTWRHVPDVTLSSDGIKHDWERRNAYMLQFNANLATLYVGSRVLITRSARSDTPQRLTEVLLMDAVARREAALRGDRPPPEVYEGAIVSALDLCPLKALVLKLIGGENELEMLHHQQRAEEAVFGVSPELACQLESGDTLTLRKPYLLELPFSGRADRPHNIERARRYNGPALERLFDKVGSQPQCEQDSPTLCQRMRAVPYVG